MKILIVKLGKWFRSLSAIRFILISSAVMLFFNFISGLIVDVLGVEMDPDKLLDFKNNTLQLAISALIRAPLLETFIFQKVIFWVLRKIKWLDRHKIYIIIISGVIFGSMHYYSVAYMVVASILGVLFMFFYISRFRKDAYWCVTAVHAIVNLVAFAGNYFGEA